MKRPTHLPNRRARAAQRGQAMVEYSILNWLLIVAIVMACTVKIIPGPKGTGGVIARRNVVSMFLEAYKIYYDSYFFVLNMPFP